MFESPPPIMSKPTCVDVDATAAATATDYVSVDMDGLRGRAQPAARRLDRRRCWLTSTSMRIVAVAVVVTWSWAFVGVDVIVDSDGDVHVEH
jgi:hypothetical protein